MSYWIHYRANFQRVFGCLAFLSNSLLITLILHKSPKKFGAYRYLMIFMSIFELFYAIVDVFLAPEVITKGTYWFCLMSSKESFLPTPVKYFLLASWGGSFGVSMGMFVVHFMYRYLVISGNKTWTSFGFRFWIWISAPIAFGLVWGLATHYFEMRTDQSDAYFEANIEEYKGVSAKDLVYYEFSFYQISKNGEEIINWFAISGNLIFATLILISFVVMTYFGTKCYRSIRALTDLPNRSSESKQLQSQLFLALVLQTSIPIILMHIPCGLVVASTILKTTTEVYGELLTASIALFPAIDPLPSMVVVQPYRKALIDCFIGMFRFKRNAKNREPSNVTLEFQQI